MRASIVIYAAAVVACGGGGSGTAGATIQGTVRGQPVAFKDAMSTDVQFGNGQNQAAVILSSAPQICSLFGNGKEPQSSQYLLVSLAQINGTAVSVPTGPGTFDIVLSSTTTRGALVVFLSTDAACQDATSGAQATAGTVTLTSAGPTYAGSFDVTLATGDHITGTFTAPSCAGLAKVLTSGTPTTCQ